MSDDIRPGWLSGGNRRVEISPAGYLRNLRLLGTFTVPAGVEEVVAPDDEPFTITDDDGPLPVLCEWFVLCENTTLRAVRHPILGPVPTCYRCEAKHVSLGGNEGFVIGLEDED